MRTLQASWEHKAIQEPTYDLGRLRQCRYASNSVHTVALRLSIWLWVAQCSKRRVIVKFQIQPSEPKQIDPSCSRWNDQYLWRAYLTHKLSVRCTSRHPIQTFPKRQCQRDSDAHELVPEQDETDLCPPDQDADSKTEGPQPRQVTQDHRKCQCSLIGHRGRIEGHGTACGVVECELRGQEVFRRSNVHSRHTLLLWD